MREFQQNNTSQLTSKRYLREERIIDAAINILYKRLQRPIVDGEMCMESIVNFLKMLLAEEEREVFIVLYMSTQLEIISVEEVFKGTLRVASVNPREIVKSAMKINAASVILCHNHTGGDCTPSKDDRLTTCRIIRALALVDVIVNDHIIISKDSYFSFEQAGLLDVLRMPL